MPIASLPYKCRLQTAYGLVWSQRNRWLSRMNCRLYSGSKCFAGHKACPTAAWYRVHLCYGLFITLTIGCHCGACSAETLHLRGFWTDMNCSWWQHCPLPIQPQTHPVHQVCGRIMGFMFAKCEHYRWYYRTTKLERFDVWLHLALLLTERPT